MCLAVLAFSLLWPAVGWADTLHGGLCNDHGICAGLVHTPIYSGSNSADITWQQACLDSGICTGTQLSDSYITTTEANQVSLGVVREF
jgi:hypothetical protein